MNIRAIILLFLSFFISLATAEARTHGQGGDRLSDKANMIGVHMSGMDLNRKQNFPGTINVDYAGVNEDDIKNLWKHNITLMRLAFSADRFQQSYFGPVDPTYSGQLDAIIALAQKYGIRVVLDNHQFGAMFNNQIGDGPSTNSAFADLCSKVATHYLGNPTVIGFEPQNEPSNMPSSTAWHDGVKSCIIAYRAIDPNTAIYVDGDGYASEYQWIPNGNDQLRDLNSLGHIVYVGHAYGDFNNCGAYPVYGSGLCGSANPTNSVCTPGASSYVCATQMGDQMDSPPTILDTNILVKRASKGQGGAIGFVPWCNQYKLTCTTDEQGVPNDDPAWLFAEDKSIAYTLSNNMQFFYFSAGEFFTGYSLGVQQQANGIDTPQWAVLCKYTNCQQNTTYQISGPVRGTAGTPSSNFSASYRGIHNKAFKITPKAVDPVTGKSSGGTFNPSSFFLSDGFNGSGNFTYNSSGLASFAIQLTNDYGLTDPAPFGYATASDILFSTGASSVNVCSLMKVNASYIGPLLTLRRSVDQVTKDFYPVASPVGSLVDKTAITKFAGGSNLSLTNCYDQFQGYNFIPVNLGTQDPDAASHSPTPSSVDEPRFYVDCGDGLPCVDMSAGGRLAATSPVPNLTQQSVFAVFAPVSNSGDGIFLGWDWSGTIDSKFWENDMIKVVGTSSIRSYTTSGQFHSIGETWTSGGNVSAFRDGAKMNTASGGSSTIFLPFNRTNLNMGYQRFSGPVFPGKWREIVITNNNIGDTGAINFTSNQAHRWSIATYPTGFYSPTLQQNIGSGNAPPWAGVNIAGAAAGGGFSTISCSPGINGGGKCPFNKSVIPGTGAYYASRGMNLVRLLVSWPALQQNLCTGDTTIDPTQLANVDAWVNEFTSNGIDVLIDLHAYGSYNYNTWTTCASPPDDGNIIRTTTGIYFQTLWTLLGAHYASNPKVYFDLTNEPNGQAAMTQATVFQGAINGARGQGFNNYIFVEFGTSFATCDHVSDQSGPAFLTLTDTQNKLVLECHRYLQSCNNDQCGEAAPQGAGNSDLAGATTYCASNGCHLYWGEFNATFDPTMYTELKNAMDLILANPSTWYGWGEYAGGPAWTETYIGKVEPSQYSPPVDRPQMRILNSYATGHSWLCKGGGTGTAGVCPGTWPDGAFP